MKRIVLFALLVAAVLCGCYQNGTVRETNLWAPYRIAAVNIPLADNINDTQFDRVSKVEEDSYGRQYYTYTTNSAMVRTDIEIHIICQKIHDDNAYYYRDHCYLILLAGDDTIAQEDLALLKERNDWDQPLNEEKMSAISVSSYYEDIAYESAVRDAVLFAMELDDSYGVLVNGLERSGGDEQLFMVNVFPRDREGKASGAGNFYFIIYNCAPTGHITMYEKVEFPLCCQDQVIAFRSKWLAQDSEN